MGEISLWHKCFFSNTCWTQLLAPLETLMSKIYLKYIPIHIHNFEHTSVIMNMKLSSHGFLFHRNINRRENKTKAKFKINHPSQWEKTNNIFLMCSKRIIELHKLESGFKKRARAVKIPICDVVGLYFCWRSWTSCLDTWHHGFYQIPTDKKSISDWLC